MHGISEVRIVERWVMIGKGRSWTVRRSRRGRRGGTEGGGGEEVEEATSANLYRWTEIQLAEPQD